MLCPRCGYFRVLPQHLRVLTSVCANLNKAVRLRRQVLRTLPLHTTSESSPVAFYVGTQWEIGICWWNWAPNIVRFYSEASTSLKRIWKEHILLVAVQCIIKLLAASGLLNPFQTRVLKCRKGGESRVRWGSSYCWFSTPWGNALV